MNGALQPIRFGKAANDPKTRYEQTNEDRLNEDLRMLQEAIEKIQAEINNLRGGA